MSICKDCIHYEICDEYVSPNESFPEVEGGCKCFKSTEDVVEVVRCKDCKHWNNEGYDVLILQDFGSCTCKYWEHPTEYFETAETDYCSYGERREE